MKYCLICEITLLCTLCHLVSCTSASLQCKNKPCNINLMPLRNLLCTPDIGRHELENLMISDSSLFTQQSAEIKSTLSVKSKRYFAKLMFYNTCLIYDKINKWWDAIMMCSKGMLENKLLYKYCFVSVIYRSLCLTLISACA